MHALSATAALPDDAAADWDLHFRDPPAALERVRLTLARPHAHDGATLAWAELTEGFHRLFATGEPALAQPRIDSAGRRFVALGERRGALLADTGRARLLVFAQQPQPAHAMLDALLPDAKRVLPPHDRFWVLNTLAGTHFLAGHVDEAIRCLYEALEALRASPRSPQLATVLSNLAAALITVGDYAPARELAQEALALQDGQPNPRVLLFARANLAEALAGTGDRDAALATVDALLADARAQPAPQQNHYLAIAAEVCAQHGRHDDARACAQLAATTWESSPTGFNEVHARWAEACVALVEADADAAIAALDAAAAVAARCAHLPVLCKAHAELSARHAARRDFERAWHAQRALLDAQERRLLNRASARYYTLRVEHELASAREERDRESTLRLRSEALNRQLAEVNAELSRRMREIEALQAQLASEAVRDPLTGLFNRRHLEAAMTGFASAAERHGTPLTLALIDLDHFKHVNDRHGHLAGDKVLRRIGRLLASSLRPSDVVVRWGGEEFCVLFPATDIAGAATALAGLATRLRALTVEWGGQVLGGFTFSAALAQHGTHGHALADLVGAADAALYAAKGAGRDRVLVAQRAPA